MAFPVQDVGVVITTLSLGRFTTLSTLSSCVADGVRAALRVADVQVTLSLSASV